MESTTNDLTLALETSLEEETLTSLLLNRVLNLRLFSARCRESQAQALVNQDYVLVEAQRDASSLCFCVCDGVGNSYRGEFAARYLGKRLVAWLQTLPVFQWAYTSWKSQLDTLLRTWASEAHQEVLQLDLPDGVPDLVREVLEELRTTQGSETVFLCGRINRAYTARPTEKPQTIEVFLCWMGNVTAHLFVSSGNCIVLGGDDGNVGGWSTGRGPRGRLHTWHTGLTTLDQLIVHTDGLNRIQRQLPELSDEGLQRLARRLLSLPQNDDMTALILQWISQNPADAQTAEDIQTAKEGESWHDQPVTLATIPGHASPDRESIL